MANAFSRPIGLGLIKETVSDAQLQQANALAQLSRSTLSIVSPALGALIVTLGSPAIAIAVDAATFFVSALLISSMRLAGRVRAVSKSIVGDLRDGWREFISRPWVVAIIASFGLFQLTYFPALLVLGPTVANEHLDGAAGWGTIIAVEAIGSVVGGLVALRVRVARPLVVSELVVVPSGFLLIALAVPLPLAAIAAVGFFVGMGFALGENLYVTAFQRNLPGARPVEDQLLRLVRVGGAQPDRLRAHRPGRRGDRHGRDARHRRHPQRPGLPGRGARPIGSSHPNAAGGCRMTEHAVVVAGGGPTGLMLAGELALAGVDVAIVERRESQDLPGSRAGGLHARTIEVFDQRGIADRFLAEGQVAQVAGFASDPRSTSATFLPATTTGSRSGRSTSSASSPAGSPSWASRSTAAREVTGFVAGRHRRRRRAVRRRIAAGGVPRRLRRRPQPGPQDGRHRVPGVGSDRRAT